MDEKRTADEKRAMEERQAMDKYVSPLSERYASREMQYISPRK